ncbi:MAG TPA: phosphogluconate dehydratase [Spongiibacteraceae bacterium]|nr:phosphogluconate dehydratase [Spongiibacteraceae bacterium]
MHSTVISITERIQRRSAKSRKAYLEKCRQMREHGPTRHHLSCSNFAHAIAGCNIADKQILRFGNSANIALVSAYNDMLSAHQPYRDYPQIIQETLSALGSTVQFAGGVPAMCDGITQGNAGMELSLFSRDVIAMATAIALAHNAFDGALLLGICDKIVPGLLIGALSFGHLPAIFIPAGPMPSGLSNQEKVRLRQEHAAGRVGADVLMDVETKSYHSPGTCTFYGTANSNQVLLECMGLMLPGSAFVNPGTPLRDALTRRAAQQITQITALGDQYIPLCDIVDERVIVNALIGLLATGGSTNHTLHWVAVARAAGIIIYWDDFAELSAVTPLLASIYPNGNADINEFQNSGGTSTLLRELISGGLLHTDVHTVMGKGLEWYCKSPALQGDVIVWDSSTVPSTDSTVLRPLSHPFANEGGLKILQGDLGRSVIKISALKKKHRVVEAPVRIFHNQEEFFAAFQAGELNCDVVVVVCYQGPQANGMPELHKLIPYLAILQDKGFHVALVTDGRLSGASGKVPAAIHVTPEALAGGNIGKLRNGDWVRVDADHNRLTSLLADGELARRAPLTPNLTMYQSGFGRELFNNFRAKVGTAEQGASVWSG